MKTWKLIKKVYDQFLLDNNIKQIPHFMYRDTKDSLKLALSAQKFSYIF